MNEQENFEKAVTELSKRTLMEKGATEKQAMELIGSTHQATELLTKTILNPEKKIEYEMLKEITKKMLVEDNTSSEIRMHAMIQLYFIIKNKTPIQQLAFADKIMEIAQAQIYGRGIKEEIKHRLRETKEFSKMF